MVSQQISTGTFCEAKWVVSATAGQGTHTTIAAALTAASSGDTIFIRPGTYTEDLTLKAGVNLAAYDGDQYSPNVIILGKATATGVGTFTIGNVQLKTNSDFCLVVSGSSATVVQLIGTYINCNNNTGISYTTSNSSSAIIVVNCTFGLATTGIAYYSMSSTGSMNCYRSDFENAGGSSTASNNSAGSVGFFNCQIAAPLSTSSSGTVTAIQCFISTVNNTSLTTAGTGGSNVVFSDITSGTASAFSIGSGSQITAYSNFINSSNTNAITGAGTLFYQGLTFYSSSLINVTTQGGGTLIGGTFQAPSAGFLGEQIRNTANTSISNATPTNLTSISLTAGIWDISGIANFVAGTGGTSAQVGIGATSATFGTQGDAYGNFVGAFTQYTGVVPSFRATLTTTTTYYLVGEVGFTGSASFFARISATRVG